MGWGVKVSIKERRERDRKERGRDKTREASGRSKWVPVDVRSGSDGGPDSVISEYGLASYFTHTHTHMQAICHPDWTLHREAFT